MLELLVERSDDLASEQMTAGKDRRIDSFVAQSRTFTAIAEPKETALADQRSERQQAT